MEKGFKYIVGFVVILMVVGCGVVLSPLSPDKFDSFKTECEQGNVVACSVLGDMYSDGIGTSQNMYLAQKAYKKSCESNNNHACSELGKLYAGNLKKKIISQDKIKTPVDKQTNIINTEATDIKTGAQQCESGNYEKCYEIGKEYESRRTRGHYKKAFSVYKKSCEASHTHTLDACYALGNLYKNGYGIRRNYHRSAKLFDHVCKNNYAKGCGDLGEMYLHGNGLEQNTLLALKLLEKGCKSDNIQSCTALGTLYVTGEGITEDYAQAHYYFEKACSQGDALACYNMGNIYENGIGRAQNMQDAKEFYGTACTAGLEESCISLKALN